MSTADPIELEPGSPEWLREMTASKVAAVLGLSPWQSRFSLWYEMAGQVPHGDGTAQMARGHYLEDGIARYVADQYGFNVGPGLCWRNRERPWQVASPDRLAYPVYDGAHLHPDRATAVVEVKTAADWEHWGPDGSDEIPVYYRAQAVWQMDCLGVDTAYVGVLLPRLELRSYVLHPVEGEAEFIREEARAFLDSLAAGDPPDVDKHSETYSTLRALHPDIVGGEVPLDPELAYAYAHAVVDLRRAEDEHTLQRSRVAAAMGDAKTAVVDGVTVATRTPAPKTGVPYVAATRSKAALANLAAQHLPTTEEDHQ